MRRRRCLVPVNSYFEWQVTDPDNKKKQPWAIGLASGEPFGLAGIWDHWENKDCTIQLETFAIITCEPNILLRPLHDRMPVLIHPEDFDRWLEPGDPKNPPMDLLKPFPDAFMKIWRVKPAVGNTRNNRPDLIDPIEPENPDKPDDTVDPGDQPSLF
jgi:putative SOS response-associated peptidase YedK